MLNGHISGAILQQTRSPQMTNITDFNNLYPVSKTLRWSLRPIGATRHFIDENKILEEDRQKAKSYENAKD